MGTINTNGGGFASIRAKIPPGSFNKSTAGVRIRFRGDGKTYKFLMSDGGRNVGAPLSRSPSWQMDVPTVKSRQSGTWQELEVPFDKLVASFGGRPQARPSAEEKSKYQFDPSSIREIGLMLSLMLSDGRPNPKKTFGEGTFPFSLQVHLDNAHASSSEWRKQEV